MGMYTELVLSARIDLSDKDFLSDLEYMVEGNDDLSKSYQNKTQHRLFQISNRWHYMLRSDSSYFSGTTHSDIFKNEDSFSPAWYLTVRCNLKNYDGEIEAFLDWLAPHISESGFLGYSRYEEFKNPTLIYLERDGKISLEPRTEECEEWKN